MTRPFDVRALTQPVDRRAVAAHKQRVVADGRAPRGGVGPLAVVAICILGLFFLSVFGTVGGVISRVFISNGAGFALAAVVPLLLPAAMVGVAVVVIVRSTRARAERWYRLDGFATANGLTWFPEVTQPPLPGMIFGQGSGRTATDLLRGQHPRFVEFANYRYTTGSGKNQTTHRWGYIAVKLTTPLPHIVLDATGNNGLLGSNLPATFDKEQRLSLEGDFDRFFTLYCPRGYEADALYLFTPDIMARFIDNAAALDVEIVDDWLFLYARRDFSTLDPRMWAWLFSVVGALLDKLAQWERWRDDRLVSHAAVAQAAVAHTAVGGAETLPFAPPVETLRPPAGVAHEGRRLQRRVPWATIIVVALFALVWLAMQTGVFGLMGLLVH